MSGPRGNAGYRDIFDPVVRPLDIRRGNTLAWIGHSKAVAVSVKRADRLALVERVHYSY